MICYDSFAKLLIQVSQIDKKTCVNDFITQYKRNLSLNKHGIFFLTEKNSQECTKLPCIIENGYFQEEFEKIEYLSKYEKHLYYIFSILPKAKFYPFLYEIPVELRESSIMFDSRFESGNLRRVYQVYFLKCFIVLNRNLSFKIVFITKINENEYELILDFDSNTSNYSQWYFFKVFNIHKGYSKNNFF